MEDDALDVKDDHNHNYCGGGGEVQLSEVTRVPPLVSPTTVSGGEPGPRQGTLWPGGSVGSKFMDSDTGSDSSEVGEAESTSPAATANNTEGKFSPGSSSKFRKFTNWTWCPSTGDLVHDQNWVQTF